MARVVIVGRNSMGMVQDTPAEHLPPEAWTLAQNVRFRDGVAERIGAAIDLDVVGDPPAQQIFPFKAYNSDHYLLLADQASVRITNGITTTNITGTSVPNAAGNAWTFTNFNGIPILNEPTIRPQALTTIPGGPLVNLPNWPATHLAGAIRSFKTFLIALNVSKSGAPFPNLVLWSDVAPPGAVPGSWNVADPAVLAGENPLASNDDDDDIEVVDGASLKDIFIIYKRLTATVMAIGGTNVFTFSKTLDKGVMARNCILRPPIREARHVVFGLDDIYSHNGYVEESLLDARLRRWLFARIDPSLSSLCHAAHNRLTGECWFMYPEIGATRVTQALIWNYRTNNISIVDLPSVWSLTTGAFSIPQPDDTWEADDLTWEDRDDTWDPAPASALRPQFLFAKSAPNSVQAFDAGAPLATATLERLGLPIVGRDQAGAPVYDTEVVKIVRGMWPRFVGAGNVTFQVGGSDTPSAPITWSPTYTFPVASRSKVDCYAVGRLLHVRFLATDTAQWRMLGYDLEIEPAGGIA